MRSVLYFDLASPYAYLAVARAARVLAEPPELEPILLGAIFKMRGSGSWAATPSREVRIAEIEARAERYGLPPLRWPRVWPVDSLAAMRLATWAKEQGRVDALAVAVYRAEFVRGEDPSEPAVLKACAEEAGLTGIDVAQVVQQPEIKERLRAATAAAWESGVRGAPTLILDGVVFYGDDQLELAAARADDPSADDVGLASSARSSDGPGAITRSA